MVNVDEIIYTPRDDGEVVKELETGVMPPEIREAMLLPEDDQPSIQVLRAKVSEIAAKLIEGNQLDPDVYTPEVYVSADQKLNAMIAPSGEKPLLVVTTGLLTEVRSEDELAGVIAHELGHKLLREKANGTQNGGASKVEELGADVVAVKLLEDAGYNPRGLITLTERLGEENFQIINVDDVRNAESLEEKASLVQRITDPHPSGNLRIRSMENAIVALNRQRGRTGENLDPVRLDRDYYNAAYSVDYETPLRAGLKKSGYFSLPEEQKIEVLSAIVEQNYMPSNKTSANRLREIASYIGDLQVDFDSPTQAEKFNALADRIMGDDIRPEEGKSIVHPSSAMAGDSITNILYPALEKAWARGHGITLQNGRRKNQVYVGRLEDLRQAVDGFTNATSAEEAERYAADVVKISDKIDSSYKMGLDFNGFYPPTEDMVKDAIARDGSYTPPYKQHVDWFKETGSENIQKVLWGMSIATDPWAATALGKKPGGWGYQYDLPTVPSDRGYKTTVGGFDEGRVTGVIQPVPAYQWKAISPDASESEITALHKQEAQNREAHDRQVVEQADWSMLRDNFQKFVATYGANIVPNQSLASVNYPFAERFFSELKEIIPEADDAYKAKVSAFLWGTFRGIDDSAHGFTEQIVANFYNEENHKWSYTEVADPKIYTLEHPLIEFITSEPGKSVVNDWSKLTFFAQTKDFIKGEDQNRPFGELFTLPLQDTLHYPHSNDVGELAEKVASGKYTSTAVAAEAERLGHALADTISMEDLFVLDKVAIAGANYPSFGKTNLEPYFKELRHQTVERHLQTDDLSELIGNYRYAVASKLMLESPDLKEAAHARIQEKIEALPEDQRLEHLRELLRPEEFSIAHNPRAINDRIKLGYDGYIEDPKFRNWTVDQYTTTLANQVGLDDGSPDYQQRARQQVSDIDENTAGITKLTVLGQFADKVNAQQELAYHIRDTYQSYAVGDALSKHMTAIVGELQVNETSRDPHLRELVLEFLSQPLTADSTKPLLEYTQQKYEWQMKKTPEVVADYQLQNYHKNFWSASLEMRTAYLEKIVFPLNSTEAEQVNIVKGLVEDAFPVNGSAPEQRERNEYAQEIVTAYLNSADLAERRLLATAMMAANMQEEGAAELSVGQKLHTVLSHLGPAGGKLMQAIHSHPQTPQDIKDDLASSKTMYDPPMRWDVVEAVEDSGLLAEDHPNRVTHIGKVVGSGSFGITVFDTLNDGTQVADTFLRHHAADRAEREFKMMHEAATELSSHRPIMKPLVGMVGEARRSAQIETDMSVAAQQNDLAQDSYHGIKVSVEQNGHSYEFTNYVTKLLDRGDNFKRVSIAPGEHFNDLPETTEEERSYKQAAAKAVLATQLSLRLSGASTDLDRHGGNIKVQGDAISHFDFGAMNITPLTAEDKTVTGKILAQVIRDVGMNSQDFSQAIMDRIEGAETSEATRTYLDGLKKDFLALGDYINTLEADDLAAVFARSLTSKTIDPEIRKAFNKEIGMARVLVSGALNSKAASAGITIERLDIGIDDSPTPDESQVKGDPEIEKGRNRAQTEIE